MVHNLALSNDKDDMQNCQLNPAVRRRRRRAFTRVELVVLMAVVAVVGAVTPPAIQTARETARRIQGRMNLRNLGIVVGDFRSHPADSPAFFPPFTSANTNIDDTDVRLVCAGVIMCCTTASAATAALAIRFGVRFVNRRKKAAIDGSSEADATSSLLERWFCPPSSSPV